MAVLAEKIYLLHNSQMPSPVDARGEADAVSSSRSVRSEVSSANSSMPRMPLSAETRRKLVKDLLSRSRSSPGSSLSPQGPSDATSLSKFFIKSKREIEEKLTMASSFDALLSRSDAIHKTSTVPRSLELASSAGSAVVLQRFISF